MKKTTEPVKQMTSLFLFFSFLVSAIFYILNSKFSHAINMESNQYRIEYGDVLGGVDEETDQFKLSTTLGQTAAGQFDSDGYIIKAGVEYLDSPVPFSFKVSKSNVNFGILALGSPKTAKTTLAVDFGAIGQYQVLAYEEGPLKTLTGASTIPDTKCDGGGNTCSETYSSTWISNKTYGFGYSLAGDDIPVDFVNDAYFRPFPDKTADEKPVSVMHSVKMSGSQEATVTLKVNISPVQPFGAYDTVVNFIALPSF